MDSVCGKFLPASERSDGVLSGFAGAKEIDIAATLEHIRDQRMIMVKTKVRTHTFIRSFLAGWCHALQKSHHQQRLVHNPVQPTRVV